MTRPRIGPDDPHRVTVTGKMNQAARDTAVVYVVDDNDSVRKSLARLIGSVGLDVETFSSASAFMERRPPGGARRPPLAAGPAGARHPGPPRHPPRHNALAEKQEKQNP